MKKKYSIPGKISLSKTLMSVILGKSRHPALLRAEPAFRRRESLSAVYLYLKDKLSSCPFKRRRKPTDAPQIVPATKKVAPEFSPSAVRAAALGLRTNSLYPSSLNQRFLRVELPAMAKHSSIASSTSILPLVGDGEETSGEPREKVVTLLLKNRVDNKEFYAKQTELLRVLEGYDAVERLRKTAANVLRTSGAAAECFDRLVDVWEKIIAKAESEYGDSESMSLVRYASYKVHADIYLLFRRTDEAIQMYKYTVTLVRAR